MTQYIAVAKIPEQKSSHSEQQQHKKAKQIITSIAQRCFCLITMQNIRIHCMDLDVFTSNFQPVCIPTASQFSGLYSFAENKMFISSFKTILDSLQICTNA